MAILTYKQTCECISLQIFSKYPIQKSRDRTNAPDLPTLKAYPTPGVGGRFEIFSLKWRERMNLKVPGAISPLGCAILSTRAKTIRGVGTTPLKRTRVKSFARHFTWLAIASFYVYGLDVITMPFLTKEQLFGQHVHVLVQKRTSGSILGTFSYRL